LKETHKPKNSHQAQPFHQTSAPDINSLTHASFARKSFNFASYICLEEKIFRKNCSDKTMGITRDFRPSWNLPESAISLSFIRQNQKEPNFTIFLAG
jgi:hypothetical protein